MDRLKESYFCRFMAKILVFLMLIQGMPLWELSQSYQWSPQKYVDLFTRVVAILSPAEAHAAAPVADAGSDKSFSKNQPVGSSIALDGSGSYDPDGDFLTYQWYGPFATTSGSSISKSISEGTYTVSLVVDDGSSRSDIDTAKITIAPCFNISARAKSGKVQLTWTHLDCAERYDIYRVNESAPFSFEKIGETTSTYSTYLDESVANETTYLYVVGTYDGSTWCYSNVISSHPTALRTRCTVNYAPVIYSSAITNGTTGIIYNYDVNATDPNWDALSYNLFDHPAGMDIDPDTGLVAWVPNEAGSYDVTVEVTDGNGESDTQAFTIVVQDITAPNRVPVADAGPDQTVFVNDTVQLDGSGSTDVDGDLLTFMWSFTSMPTGSTAILSDPTAVNLGFDIDEPGIYVVQLIINDGVLDSDPDTVTISTENRKPVADAGPDQTMNQGDTVQLNGSSSSDPDGDPLTYSWSFTSAPSGSTATLSNPAIVNPTFVADLAGTYVVQLVVNDGMVESDPDTVTIMATEQLITVPDFVGMEQTAAEAAIIAANLSVGNITTQNSATVPAGHVISQNPVAGVSVAQSSAVDLVVSLGPVMVTAPDVVGQLQANAEAAILVAGLVVGAITTANSDTVPAGNVISQVPVGGSSVIEGSAVDLVVSLGPAVIDDYTRPEVSVTIAPTVANVGESVTITVNATDNESVVSQELLVNGVSISLDASGTATFSSLAPGVFTAVATALDAAENEGLDSEEFRFLSPGDTTPPTVAISSPADDAKLSVPTDIIGTASDDTNLTRYKLEYSVKNKNEFITFACGTSPVTDGVLGSLDPTMMRNGLYDVRLTAEDASGNTASITRTYQLEGEMKVGNFTISFNDLTIPVAGIPITITRTYDSRVKTKGDFGVGWTMDLKTVEVQENRVPGEGWEVYCTKSMFGTCIEWGVRPTNTHSVLVTFPDGRDHEFDVQAVTTYAAPSGLAQGHLTFAAQSGTFSTLLALDNTTYDFLMGNELLDFDFDIIDPNRYRLTDVDGTVLVCNQSTGLEQITDPNGNAITFTADGIIHSAGKSVTFTRDAQGRITTITDPMGNIIQYEYDFYGDLVSVTDQEGNTTEFTYNSSHGLVDVIDPRGIRPARNEYDDQGRLIATIDADGNRIEFTHNIGARQAVIHDRLGNITVYEYDEDGNVLTKTDAIGNTTGYTYDANGNKLTETDPPGNTTSYTYDARGNQLTKTDPLGNTTTWTYNSRNKVLTKTDPLGNTTTKTYDAKGNLLTVTDPLGNTKTHTYDASGNKTTTTDCFGVTSYTYDSHGNKLSETDPLGNVTTYSYDANANQLTKTKTRTTDSGQVAMTRTKVYDSLNQVIETIDSNGNSEEIEYNSVRKRSATVDKNGNCTEYEYDRAGNVISTVYQDGSSETNSYDAEGNRVEATDRAGRTTQYEYDALKRLTRTILPDGSIINLEYDAAGRIDQNTDENGNTTMFEYDAAGRRTNVTDALGNETTFAYDANGNEISMTDANGNTTQYEYDALNRKTRIIFPDGTSTSVTYDGCGTKRKLSETDQGGNMTQFKYDALGRLTEVIDANGGETTYAYDEVGNRLSQTDANGNINYWDYDNPGRVISHTLPLGQSESFQYDANGNMISKTDFNGDTISYLYDVNNRLVSKSYPGGSEVSYVYTATGKRASVTDTRGVTAYDYNLRDRALGVNYPDGSSISYTYDAKGNRTAVTTPSGVTAYTYDALNRLQTVTDIDSGVTTYTYDSVGNRASVTYPNETITTYSYDTLNRLVSLINARSDSIVISSYNYTVGPAGNRLSVVEDTGRTINYTYDAVYRLIQEDITDAALGNETISYTYDPVGNRLTKTDTGGITNYTYDANNRLVSEGTLTYTYDDNGNTVGKTDGVEMTAYEYDYENRLVAVDTPSSEIDYAYDMDGVRVQSIVDGTITDYVVDKNRDYAQVMEERDVGGFLIVGYVYGDDLVSQRRGSQTTYYLYDGQGSTRQLANTSQAVTDIYVFDAFGIELHRTGTTENNYLYTGEQYDPNIGFYYLRARYYNLLNGRFITQDTFRGNPFDPVTLHKYLYANANPVMFADPSGEMSIVNVMVSIAIVGILASIAYAGFFHLISMAHTPVEWNGILVYKGGGSAGVGALGFLAYLKSECHFGKKADGLYLMGAVGGMVGPIPVSMAVAMITLQTPGIFGPKPWTLVGPFSWISATATWGYGGGWTAMYMGMGIGEMRLMPGAAYGIDIGLDAMGGLSIPIYMSGLRDC